MFHIHALRIYFSLRSTQTKAQQSDVLIVYY